MLLACNGALDLSSDVSMSSIEVNDIKKGGNHDGYCL